ncbi:MAG: four-carbon acid sugar kinase family protein, partial [Lachnospiraceae bacterium]|nr:four-carbon acid sugar kinase family protein [Lachnospiraceae bacterium]
GVMLAQSGAGAQSPGGLSVLVTGDPEHSFLAGREGPDVLVIDTETRHLPPEDAYRITSGIIRRAAESAVPHIYIKTDSALRGNIGPAFRAALDASGFSRLSFIPAFPQMNRTVLDGRLRINGVPLTESFYAADPLNRVISDDVGEVIRTQSGLPVRYRSPEAGEETALPDVPFVDIWDAVSTDDLVKIRGDLLASGRTELMAGCAGFAGQLLHFPEIQSRTPLTEPDAVPSAGQAGRPKEQKLSSSAPPLLILCGSLTRASGEQILFAGENGMAVERLSPEEKYDPAFWSRPEGQRRVRSLLSSCAGSGMIAGSFEDTPEDALYREQHQLSFETCAANTANSIAGLLRAFIEEGLFRENVHLLITGGDTLKACLGGLGVREIRPLYELMPGVVVSSVTVQGRPLRFISKSGGFGDPDLFVRLSKIEEL